MDIKYRRWANRNTMKTIINNVLTDAYVDKVKELFEYKHWNKDTNMRSEFDRFCKRLADLDDDNQRDLVLELSEDYLKIDFQDYERLLLEVWGKYFLNNSWDSNNGQLNKGNLFICPMISNVNRNAIKSGMVMAYICQDIAMRRLKEFRELQIRMCGNPADLIDKVDKVRRLVLIDDYIGSGSTAIESIAYVNNICKIENNKIDIVSLVAQKEAINLLKDMNINVYTAIERSRGISDKYTLKEEVEEKINTMKKISRKLKVDDNNLLGYEQTEALVSMIRTPNNTFPVYWIESKKIKSPAPFPRAGNIKFI